MNSLVLFNSNLQQEQQVANEKKAFLERLLNQHNLQGNLIGQLSNN